MSRPRHIAVCTGRGPPPSAEIRLKLRRISTFYRGGESRPTTFWKGVIPIDTNSRMKEIAGNLRRDVKDLLGDSASIVTGFFKNGLCTVRGAATRWRNFTRDISGAFVSLFKSAKEATLPDLSPEQEPIGHRHGERRRASSRWRPHDAVRGGDPDGGVKPGILEH